jgi:hypothetical protein
VAALDLREDLIASRFGGLSTGPLMLYSFETQSGIPVDSGNPLLRGLSPFTIRIIPPTLVEAEFGRGTDVNLLGRAGQSVESFRETARAVRGLFGIGAITGSSEGRALGTLQQIVSAGQVISSATTEVERTVITDQYTAADIALQVERILQTPPLTLLVNPNNMSMSYGTVQQFSNRNRYGFIFERWGESQPTISFSGSTGAFIAGGTQGPSGLQFASKRDSAAFQNFVSLVQFYKNSGMIFDEINQTMASHMVGALAIDYDQWTWVGHIDSFDYSYGAEDPHRIQWSMSFTVDQMYDLAQAPTSVRPLRDLSSGFAPPDEFGGSGTSPEGAGRQFAEVPLSLLIPGS